MPLAEINGIRLYYESHGEGEPVVFAHGAGGNHLSWWQQVPAFRDRYRCIVFDHRGFGRSEDAEGGPGWSAHCDDLRALMDALGVVQARLVAQSMGGGTCMGFAAAYPERVKALVMADTALGIANPAFSEQVRAYRESQGGPQPLQGRAYGPRLAREQPAMAFLYDSLSALNAHAATSRRTPAGAPFLATDEKRAGWTIPTLFLGGSDDVIFPPHLLRLASDLVPNATFVEVPGSGHSVYFEDAPAFNRIVLGFFAANA